MVYVLLGAFLGLIPSGFLTWILLQSQKDHKEQRVNWEQERERLLNRAMTKEWESYTQMSQALLAQASPLTSEQYQGMNDAEELRRAGAQDGVGEVLYDFTEEFKELGLS